MRQVKWGVVGCSDIVSKRAGAAIVDQGNSVLEAFLSRDIGRARAFADRFGAEAAYDHLDPFLSHEGLDIVYVATEVDRHEEATIAAAAAGKHVLVEKPMALTAASCRRMIEAARANGVHLAVAYYVRFFEKSRAMRRLIADGGLGQIVRANIRVMGYYNPDANNPQAWRVGPGGGGNQLADIGSHRLDLLSYFIGRPVAVFGLTDRLTMDYAAADTETALVRYENGAHVTVLANANTPAPGGSTTLEIYGTEGSLLTDPWGSDPVQVIGADLPAILTSAPTNAHFPMIDDFATAIAEGRAPRFSGVDGMWATAVIEGVYESSRTGRIVEIPPVP
jgi:predicted dehydrogenase